MIWLTYKKSIIHTPGVFSGLLMKSVRLLVKRLHRQHLITAGKDQCLSRICTTIFSPFLSLSQFASCRGCSSLFVIESGRVWQIYGLSSGKFGTTAGTARYTDCFPLLPLFLQRNPNEKFARALWPFAIGSTASLWRMCDITFSTFAIS